MQLLSKTHHTVEPDSIIQNKSYVTEGQRVGEQ